MTGATIGEILPFAVGVAISPIPIIAVILMLLAPQAKGTSVGFLAGWLVGIVGALLILLAIGSRTSLDSGDSSDSGGTLKLAIGVLLILAAGRQWRGRPKPGEEPKMPGWMRAIDSFTPVRAAGLGVVLSAVNPKNLLLILAASVSITQAGLESGEATTVIAVFVVIAASTVLIPVLGYLVASAKMRGPLDDLKVWLQSHNAAVMATLLLVFGVVLLGKGITALSL